MAKLSQQTLPESPFITYRDPETGRWIVENSQDPNNYNHVSELISGDHRLEPNPTYSIPTEEKMITH